MAAAEELEAEGISVQVIDAYSIQPKDIDTVRRAMAETASGEVPR